MFDVVIEVLIPLSYVYISHIVHASYLNPKYTHQLIGIRYYHQSTATCVMMFDVICLMNNGMHIIFPVNVDIYIEIFHLTGELK